LKDKPISAPQIGGQLKDKSISAPAAWLRRLAAALCSLAFFATALSLAGCSGPSNGSGPDSASRSGVQFYGTIDTGVGYEHTSN